MIYTPKQRALMELWRTNRLRRINILEGSVSSGKTWISLVMWAFWVKTMPADPDALYMMCARSLTTLKRNCLLLLQSLVGESNFRFSLNTKEGLLFGRKILLEGANDSQAEAKIRGLTLQGAYCDEATKLPRDFWTMLLSRLRRRGAKLFATTNPDAPYHWLKAEYIDRADELDLLDVKFSLTDNTALPEDYVENIMREYTGVFYRRFILGEWTLAEGLIYPMYEECIEAPPVNGDIQNMVLSVDYGTMNAFAAALWARYHIENRGDVWFMIDEYYYSGRAEGVPKTDEEYAEALDDWLAPLFEGSEMYRARYSEQNRLRTIVDPSAASFIALLRKRRLYRVVPADNDVMDGIRETATCMQVGKIRFSPRCKAWRSEVQGYVWDEESKVDKPVKVNDHMMDAVRYFVKTSNIVRPKTNYTPIWQR